MTNSKLNLGLIFFLFVLFAGMTYAAVYECGNLTGHGGPVLT
jgi:hypothetical protein